MLLQDVIFVTRKVGVGMTGLWFLWLAARVWTRVKGLDHHFLRQAGHRVRCILLSKTE